MILHGCRDASAFCPQLLHRFATLFEMINIRISPGNYLIEGRFAALNDYVLRQDRICRRAAVHKHTIISHVQGLLPSLPRGSGEMMFAREI